MRWENYSNARLYYGCRSMVAGNSHFAKWIQCIHKRISSISSSKHFIQFQYSFKYSYIMLGNEYTIYEWCVSSPSIRRWRRKNANCVRKIIHYAFGIRIDRHGPIYTYQKHSDMCAASPTHSCLRMDECVVTKTARTQYKLIGYLMLTEKGGSN